MLIKSCFNRYIVECKYDLVGVFFYNDDGFNRYIVECKYYWIFNGGLFLWVLIDT